jgi:hypothetical protein
MKPLLKAVPSNSLLASIVKSEKKMKIATVTKYQKFVDPLKEKEKKAKL